MCVNIIKGKKMSLEYQYMYYHDYWFKVWQMSDIHTSIEHHKCLELQQFVWLISSSAFSASIKGHVALDRNLDI